MKTTWILGILTIGGLAGIAEAGPTTRFGLTYGVAEPTLPGAHELGPTLAVGYRLGPIVAEVDYAYLSFLDDNTGDHGVQRLGLTGRLDLWRDTNRPCIPHLACTRAMSVYGEGGVAERFGHWQLDATTIAPVSGRQHEAHLGFGLEIDNRITPYRYGWQIGFRVVAAPRDPQDFLCRSASGCGGMMTSTSYDRSVLVDVSWIVGQ